MSDIVKEGSLDRIIERQLAKRRFVCNNCGCEFIATKYVGLLISGRITEILNHTFFSCYNGRISEYDLFEIKLKPYEGGIYNGKFQIYR